MTVFYDFPAPNYINRHYVFSLKTITSPHGLNGALFRTCKQRSPSPCPGPGVMWNVLHNTRPGADPGPGDSQCEYTSLPCLHSNMPWCCVVCFVIV